MVENKYIGMKIKRIRENLNISQSELAEVIGVSYQQLQKYEKGLNKISAERLGQIAKALKVYISYFFEEGKEEAYRIEDPLLDYKSILYIKSTEEDLLLKRFRAIKNEDVRKGILLQLKGLMDMQKKMEAL